MCYQDYEVPLASIARQTDREREKHSQIVLIQILVHIVTHTTDIW